MITTNNKQRLWKECTEPEVMESEEESIEYDAMDFTEVNTAFAKQAIALGPPEQGLVLDAGTGPGRIPVLLCQVLNAIFPTSGIA